MRIHESNPTIWNTYFNENDIIEKFSTKLQINRKSGKFYVTSSVFTSLNRAILIDKSSNNYLLISRSTFSNCFTEEKGASIYFSQGSILIHEVCGMNSTNTGKDGTFCGSVAEQNSKHLNSIIESSICDCGKEGIGESLNLFLNGNVSFISNNISKNKTLNDVIFCSISASAYNLRYCSFTENQSPGECAWFHSSILCPIYKCNILDNDSKKGNLFETIDQIVFSECCILRNNAGLSHFKKDKEGSITLSRCNFDRTEPNVIIHESTGVFYIELLFLSVESCSIFWTTSNIDSCEVPSSFIYQMNSFTCFVLFTI